MGGGQSAFEEEEEEEEEEEIVWSPFKECRVTQDMQALSLSCICIHREQGRTQIL